VNITVIIAKQEKITVEVIREALISEGYDVKATTSSKQETSELLKKYNPDLLILGCELSGMSNMDALKSLTIGSNTKMIMFTRNSDLEEALLAIKLGVSGYVNVDIDLEELMLCVKAVLNGSKYFCSITRNTLFMLDGQQQAARPIKNSKLSDQENRILNLVAEGKTNDEIADNLSIAPNTVNNHRANIRKKLDLKGGKSILLQYAISQKNYFG
jgi:DNA-binding NarL/FixJ family response regulator